MAGGAHRIDHVIVSEAALASSDPFSLTYAVLRFVDSAERAGYRDDELPEEAVLAARVETYVGEVLNGGHGQWVSNTDGEKPLREAVRRGLAIIGCDAALAIFDDLDRFAERHPQRYQASFGSADDIDPYYFELDTRFFELPEHAVRTELAAWLRTREWLVAIPDADHAALRGDYVPQHPRCPHGLGHRLQ